MQGTTIRNSLLVCAERVKNKEIHFRPKSKPLFLLALNIPEHEAEPRIYKN